MRRFPMCYLFSWLLNLSLGENIGRRRDPRSFTPKVPNPESVTESPFLTDSRTSDKNPSMISPVALIDTPLPASLWTISFLFNQRNLPSCLRFGVCGKQKFPKEVDLNMASNIAKLVHEEPPFVYCRDHGGRFYHLHTPAAKDALAVVYAHTASTAPRTSSISRTWQQAMPLPEHFHGSVAPIQQTHQNCAHPSAKLNGSKR